MKYQIKLPDVDPKRVWFTSDWHLYHKNVIKFDDRPFETVSEMNETIIQNHEGLGPDDHLFILGDLTFKRCSELDSFLHRIQAKKYFLVGNHDKQVWKRQFMDEHFVEYYAGYAELMIDFQLITMSHYPYFEWNKAHHGSWHLFGHTHGNDDENPRVKDYKVMNVGVMQNNYFPFNYEQIEERFKNRKNIQHH